jgi:hypothetical protein
MKSINFNRETPTYDTVARFYLTPIGTFRPWKYVAAARLDSILAECYKNCNKTTAKMIEDFANNKNPYNEQ